MFLTMFLYWVYLQELGHGTSYSWIKYFLFGLLTAYIFARPKDELAVDTENVYYFKKSIFRFLNKTTEYKISKIKSIRGGGVFSDKTEVFGLLGSGTNRNKIEITFKDNSSKSHSLTIYKKDLTEIVAKVNERLNQNSA